MGVDSAPEEVGTRMMIGVTRSTPEKGVEAAKDSVAGAINVNTGSLVVMTASGTVYSLAEDAVDGRIKREAVIDEFRGAMRMRTGSLEVMIASGTVVMLFMVDAKGEIEDSESVVNVLIIVDSSLNMVNMVVLGLEVVGFFVGGCYGCESCCCCMLLSCAVVSYCILLLYEARNSQNQRS